MSATSTAVQPEDCQWILLVARRNERTSLEDPTPHRNSLVGLYRRETAGWRLDVKPLPIRSHSTAQSALPINDFDPDDPKQWGYVSVPFGVFMLKQGPWRDNVTPAFLISDWGRTDGTITLQDPQVIAQYQLVEIDGQRVTTESVIRSGLTKTGSWLHPTHTRIWSAGDSRGCLNLYRSDKGEPPDQYGEFLSWLKERELEFSPESPPVPMILVPFEWVTADGDTLVEILVPETITRARELHGSLIASSDPQTTDSSEDLNHVP
ncbi:hypothetical protein GC173_12865 [bacterium]|nr:hypothetical protein [bacterium]